MNHILYFEAAQKMGQLKDQSIDMVVTSPPYPMIEMWDEIMANQNPNIRKAFEDKKPREAFELMHQELDKVWTECWRVMKEGAFMCINIGDATRTIDGNFALYNNNTRIIQCCEKLGFTNLPNILWKKTANAPNKFMGSGMLPVEPMSPWNTNGFSFSEKEGNAFIRQKKRKRIEETAPTFGKKEIFGSPIFGILKE